MKIAILTNLTTLHPGYSLTGIASDQKIMLEKYGHEVDAFVGTGITDRDIKEHDYPVDILPAIPTIPPEFLVDYSSVQQLSDDMKDWIHKTANVLSDLLDESLPDVIFTHDWIFGGRQLPYAETIRLLCERDERLRNTPWLHWVHSVPTAHCDWWDLSRYPSNHTIIYENETDRHIAAHLFQADMMRDVRVIPHVKDVRTFWEFDERTCELIESYPGLMQADIVQIYPVSSDRLKAKRVDRLIQIFGELKRRGLSVCLCIANSWVTQLNPSENLELYLNTAQDNGLNIDDDHGPVEFCFTSQWVGQEMAKDQRLPCLPYLPYEFGLPKRILRELSMLSNLFVYPTRAESFGLVLPEVSLSSGAMCVLNASLPMMREVAGPGSLSLDFGSFVREWTPKNEGEWIKGMASLILARMREDKSVIQKSWFRQNYNMDVVYRNYYEPILEDLKFNGAVVK